MEAAVRGLQVVDVEVQVTLGRGETSVPEDFLDVPQVGLVLQKMRGAGVPPDVAGDVLFESRRLGAWAMTILFRL